MTLAQRVTDVRASHPPDHANAPCVIYPGDRADVKGDEAALTTGVCGPDYGICVARRGERVEPFELGVVKRADGKGFLDADCFAQPLFDEAERRWMCAFWTTNALGGVLATTNRVFIAPATGYARRVVVPLEMCH